MSKRLWWMAAACAALAVSGEAVAQSARDDVVVSAEWVEEHLEDPNLVLLQVGTEETFAREHIPGASHLDFGSVTAADSHDMAALVLELPEPAELEATLEALGISDDSKIVVYWADQHVTPTTRVIFTLDWAGLGERTVLMDGGLGGWKAAGHAVTDEASDVSRGELSLRPRGGMVVQAEWVQEHAGTAGYTVLDGRAPAFYEGVREDQGRGGHIRHAESVHWQELVEQVEEGYYRLKGEHALREVFDEAGVAEDDTVVAYCHIGQYATVLLFAARTLGHDVVLYDGAWQDWAARGLPAVKAASGH